MYTIFRIPVKTCAKCGRIFLNANFCFWCGRDKRPPLPPRHQFRDFESIPTMRRNYYESDLPVD